MSRPVPSFLLSAGIAQAVQRVLAVAFGIFLYVAQTVERVRAVAFGKKLRWFESDDRHISLCIRTIENIY